MAYRGDHVLEDVLDRVDEQVQLLRRYQQRRGGGGGISAERDLLVEDAYRSACVAGISTTFDEVARLLTKNGSGGAPRLREVRTYAEAAKHVYSHASDLEGGYGVTIETVLAIHRILEPGGAPPSGPFRTEPAMLEGTGEEAVDPSATSAIEAELAAWCSWSRSSPEHALVHAAHLHAQFGRIRPFTDGNGRLARLLINLMLLARGYPPSLIGATRTWYIHVLARADMGLIRSLADVLARGVEAGAWILLDKVASDEDPLPLQVLAGASTLSYERLRRVARDGGIEVERGDHILLSSRASVAAYESRHGGDPDPVLR